MRGHVRKRGKTWAVVYDEGRDDGGRRQQRWRGGFATKREAGDALTKVLGALDRGEYVAPERLTFGEFVRERWLPIVEATMRQTTYEAYARTLRKHVLPAIGGVQLQRLDAARLDRLYLDLRAKGLAGNTVRFIAAVISSSLDYAERKHLVPRNVAKRSDPPAWKRKQATTWSARELGKFLAAVADEPDYPLWRFLALTGCRRGEALGLTWLGLDHDSGAALIAQQVVPVKGGLIFTEPKTERGRRLIPLDPGTVRVLREHRDRQLELRGLHGEAYEDHDLVFCHPDGRPLDPRGVTQRFQRLRKAAGLPHIRGVHGLRHGVATMALQAEVHAEVVSRRLGHANVGITLGTYTHAASDVERKAAEAIAGLVDAAGSE